MWKECKIISLSTEDKTGILKTKNGYWYNQEAFKHLLGADNQHLYFLSDDEIKEGDWCYNPNAGHAVTVYPDGKQIENLQPAGIYKHVPTTNPMCKEEKKIIASTDPSLNVARPSDGFIKEYCQKGSIDSVVVKYTYNTCNDYDTPGRVMGERWNYRPKITSENTIIIKNNKNVKKL